MMDPHTAAELDLDQIWTLVDDLLAAHEEWLPKWYARAEETACGVTPNRTLPQLCVDCFNRRCAGTKLLLAQGV
jgi:hypothetical protein